MDQLLEIREACPFEDRECPLVGELRRLKEECKRLQQLTQIDVLTGFFNLSYLFVALEREMERARRASLSVCLVMIDLDHFKRINDTHGHECGNEALQWASKVWRESIRRIDIPCRYGGEEFAIILPGAHLSQAVRMAQRLRLLLAESPVQLEGEPVRLTASFGVDLYEGLENLSVEAFIKRTDQFLLEAKRRGRNCVCYEKAKAAVPAGVTDEEREALLINP